MGSYFILLKWQKIVFKLIHKKVLTLNYTGGILNKLSHDSDIKEYKKSKIVVDNEV